MSLTTLRSPVAILAALCGLYLSSASPAEPAPAKPAPKTISLNGLSMEVAALQTINHLQLNKDQIEKVQKWAEESIQKEQSRKTGKASQEFRDKLLALRKALLDAKDAQSVEKLQEELDALFEKEKPTLDDRVEMTELSRKHALEAYRLLKPNQLAFYLGRIAENVSDPLVRLLDAFEEVREMKDEEWKENGAGIADDISRVAVGLDAAKSKNLSDRIVTLLTQVRGLSKAEFEKRQPELEQTAHKLIGEIGSAEILRHYVELDLATLLANPRTPPACRAIIKSNSDPKADTPKK
jgi:hypothetical protein